jgi:hypothetical protein
MSTPHDVALDCLAAAESGRRNFPEIVRTLIAAGFEAYAIDFRRGAATYYGGDGTALDVPAHRPDVPIAPAFDASALRAAIREAQTSARATPTPASGGRPPRPVARGTSCRSLAAASSTSGARPRPTSSTSRPVRRAARGPSAERPRAPSRATGPRGPAPDNRRGYATVMESEVPAAASPSRRWWTWIVSAIVAVLLVVVIVVGWEWSDEPWHRRVELGRAPIRLVDGATARRPPTDGRSPFPPAVRAASGSRTIRRGGGDVTDGRCSSNAAGSDLRDERSRQAYRRRSVSSTSRVASAGRRVAGHD